MTTSGTKAFSWFEATPLLTAKEAATTMEIGPI
jgi:hypothetical protein